MLIKLKVRKFGSSLGAGGSYMLTQEDPVSKKAADIIGRYGNTLRALAN
jgi:hypothetical protein